MIVSLSAEIVVIVGQRLPIVPEQFHDLILLKCQVKTEREVEGALWEMSEDDSVRTAE